MRRVNEKRALVVLGALLVAGLTACASDTGDAADCASGTEWIGGDEGDGDMYPGQDCVACHVREGEGPRFTTAGTVYAEVGERDDCFGVEGITVEITDANGSVTRMKTRESGNFYKEGGSIATPYTAKIIASDGTETAMLTPQTDLQCNSCHTAEGAEGAAGRIYVP